MGVDPKVLGSSMQFLKVKRACGPWTLVIGWLGCISPDYTEICAADPVSFSLSSFAWQQCQYSVITPLSFFGTKAKF